jgi:hypothetical protein
MYVRIDRARCVTPFTVERHSLVICMPAKCQSTRGICEIVTQCVDGRGQEQPCVGVGLAIISLYRVATKTVVDKVLYVRWDNSYESQFYHILELEGPNQTPEYYQCDYPTKCDCLTNEIYPERVGSHILALAPTRRTCGGCRRCRCSRRFDPDHISRPSRS